MHFFFIFLCFSPIIRLSLCKEVWDFSVKDASGSDFALNQYRGYVLLLVNVASQCLYVDDHYESLVPLQAKYAHQNFTVLAFPCNQFGYQEPWSDGEIQEFVKSHYDVNFPILQKVNVLPGEAQNPLWKYITDIAGAPTWNFWKYLIDRNGDVIGRWNERVPVRTLENEIRKALGHYHEREL